MLTPPADLPVETIAAALGIDAATMVYRPVGFGSQHWSVGEQWFVTVDDLAEKRRTVGESLDVAFERLCGALGAAGQVAGGCAVAPARPVVRLGHYAAAIYRYVDGRSFAWGRYGPGEHRDAVLAMLIDVHAAPTDGVPRDDFAVPHRDALEATLGGAVVGRAGPYEQRAAALINDNATAVRRLLDRYDALAARADPGRAVLTHGEPHPGNTMHTKDGWRLIDWDTALVAPPERDLWLLGGELTAYTRRTGVDVLPQMLEMYALRWDIADLAMNVDRFRRPHTGTADDAECFANLTTVIRGTCS